MRRNRRPLLRRLARIAFGLFLLLVDAERAFVGGINFSADHLADFGPTAKQDYSIEVEGPVVSAIRDFMLFALHGDGTGERWRPTSEAGDVHSTVQFVCRDNRRRSRAIEVEYRRAIRAAPPRPGAVAGPCRPCPRTG